MSVISVLVSHLHTMSRRAADGQPAGQPPAKKPFDINSIRAQIAAKKAEVEARLATESGSASPRESTQAGMDPDIAARIAAAKSRIDALKNKSKPVGPAAPAAPGSSGIALHPLLMADNVEASKEKNEKKALQNRYKTMAPKFSSVRANQAAMEEAAKAAAKAAPTPIVVTNPYTSVPEEGEAAEAQGQRAPQRKSRKIAFAAPGKYVKQGDQLRNDIKLEELKQRIAAQSKKAGLDSEFDVLERSLRRMVPPQVEWWDEAILPPGGTYDDIPAAEEYLLQKDSLVNHLVQHPIPIAAPSDRLQSERGLMLTKKEQKKMRRQRRLAEIEDKRDRQKMGLIPPDPPKGNPTIYPS